MVVWPYFDNVADKLSKKSISCCIRVILSSLMFRKILKIKLSNTAAGAENVTWCVMLLIPFYYLSFIHKSVTK